MTFPERIVVGVLTLWTVVSVGYCFRPLRSRLFPRWNRQFHTWTTWRLFGTDDRAVLSGVLELDYRDLGPDGSPGPWTTVEATCWSWHAFLWLPERRLANRVYHLIRELAAAIERARTTSPALLPQARLIGAYLRRRHPIASGKIRELRLVIRHQVQGPSEKTLCSFSLEPDGCHG